MGVKEASARFSPAMIVNGTGRPASSARTRVVLPNGVSLEVEQAVRCLYDARIPIDNGAVERLHVRAALKRKNFLFAGSDAGGRRAAVAYTALGSCRLAGVNPEEYVADVLPRLARRVTEAEADQLLPEFRRRNGPSVTQD